jgi:hypothetical protein
MIYILLMQSDPGFVDVYFLKTYRYRFPVLRIRDVLSRIRIRPLLHPGSGGKKAPDPGSDLFLYKGY